ncbi:MAG: hypothetical protein U0271_11645 [Polyangiaceae bacterium]
MTMFGPKWLRAMGSLLIPLFVSSIVPATLTGCKDKETKKQSDSDDDDDKGKKKKDKDKDKDKDKEKPKDKDKEKPGVSASAPASAPTPPTPTESAAPEAPNPPSSAEPAVAGDLPDVKAILGSKADGFAPAWIASKPFKKGMTPEEAGKIFPGAEKTNEYGFAEVETKEPKGVSKIKFFFLESDDKKSRKLYSITLIFDPKLKTPALWDALVKQASAKWGAPPKEDIEKKILTWVSDTLSTVQITEGVLDDEGFEVEYSFT